MKSIEEIDRRLEEIRDKQSSVENSMEASYLKLAKEHYNEEHWLYHLLRKYTYETRENNGIIEALKWVLEDEEIKKEDRMV